MGMGQQEERSARLGKRIRVRDAVLQALYGAGVVSVALLAPNAVQLLKHIDPDFSKKRRADYRIQESIRRLEKAGSLLRRGTGYELTERGFRQAELAALATARVPRSWDRKWRVVIFDVWESRKSVRNRLRALLAERGFVRLQDSVWVYPYPCEEFIVLLRAELKLGGALVYIIAESIDSEKKLIREFGIPY